jgi:hypothetical protein
MDKVPKRWVLDRKWDLGSKVADSITFYNYNVNTNSTTYVRLIKYKGSSSWQFSTRGEDYKYFKTKTDALKYAYKYMRANSYG